MDTPQVNDRKNEEHALDIFSILRDVLRSWLLILMAGIVAAMGMFVYATETYHPVYTSRITFVVTDTSSSATVYSNLSTAINLAQVFGGLFNDHTLQEKVAVSGGVEDFSGKISASVVPETNLLVISVTAQSPAEAYKMAKALVEHHTEVTETVIGNAVLEVLESPVLPAGPNAGMNRSSRVKKAAVLGVLLAAAVVAVISYFRDTVKNVEDVSTKLDLPLLSVLYHEEKYKTLRQRLLRRKKGILISDSTTSFGFTEACKQLRTRIEYRTRAKGQKVLLVTSVLENEGKSTVAANLALTLAGSGRRTLLVDADLRKPSIRKLFSLGETKGQLTAVLDGKLPFAPEQFPKVANDLHVLCESQPVSAGIGKYSGSRMETLLRVARKHYDYIVVDTPPMSAAADAESLAAAADAS
ncbi:MAG: P-loop NTPase, partial [Clostridia bacterium]|nr:P-loop NTPase [Clostridia bacterium]